MLANGRRALTKIGAGMKGSYNTAELLLKFGPHFGFTSWPATARAVKALACVRATGTDFCEVHVRAACEAPVALEYHFANLSG